MEVSLPISVFEFETLYINEFGHRLRQQRREAHFFKEPLVDGAFIEMVQLPKGTTLLGSPMIEKNRMPDEDEPHPVTFESFYMSKYPVTQFQWRAVASLPKVLRTLTPDPSTFKGLNRPAEQVSWFDAVEFCARVSQKTQRSYRLPTEAEWEYACRGGSQTPFCYGETLISEIANYRGEDRCNQGGRQRQKTYHGTYAQEPIGIARDQTTDVGSFSVANLFGLYDLHGNVWEWCLQNPRGELETEDSRYQRPARGGSWQSIPAACRTALRMMFAVDSEDASLGFRVVYSGIGKDPAAEQLPVAINQAMFSNVYISGNLTVGDMNQSAFQSIPNEQGQKAEE